MTMQKLFVSLCLLVIIGTSAFAQGVPPVRQNYLSPVSVETGKEACLDVRFSYHKDGGLRYHDQRQAQLLIYLKKDEAEILKIARVAEKLDNPKTDLAPFDKLMADRKLIIPLEAKLAKRLVGAAEKPKRRYQFPLDSFFFNFQLDYDTLLTTLKKLDHFDKQNVIKNRDTTTYRDEFGLIVFVPLNNSRYATLVPQRLRKLSDVGKFYRAEAPILYFRPLPCNFQMDQHDEDISLNIN